MLTPALHPAGPPGVTDLPPSLADTDKKALMSRHVAADIVGLLDCAAVIVGAIVPATIYSTAGGAVTNWVTILQSALVTAILVHGCLRHWSMYDMQLMHDFPSYPGRLMGALLIGSFAVLGLGLPFAPRDAQLWVWYGAWVSTSFTLLLLIRMTAHAILSRLTAAGRFDTRIAVYGAGRVARRVHDHLRARQSGIRFVGVYDDRGGARSNGDGLEIDGGLEQLIAAGRDGLIDQIIIALPPSADRRMAMIASKLEQLPVSVHVVTHIASDLVDEGPAHKVSSIGSVGLLDVKAKPLADWSPLVKRLEDKFLGALLLLLALPLMGAIALAIRLETRGPALVRQRCCGLNHKTFEVVRFRTMDVTEGPRVTLAGRILKRTSLDGLPQLFNVLRGEMSIVGPQPHDASHDDHRGASLEAYFNRHQIKPGMTGLTQLEVLRNEGCAADPIQQRVNYDLAYIRNWSLWLDLKIIGLTALTVLIGSTPAEADRRRPV